MGINDTIRPIWDKAVEAVFGFEKDKQIFLDTYDEAQKTLAEARFYVSAMGEIEIIYPHSDEVYSASDSLLGIKLQVSMQMLDFYLSKISKHYDVEILSQKNARDFPFGAGYEENNLSNLKVYIEEVNGLLEHAYRAFSCKGEDLKPNAAPDIQ